LAKWTNRSVEKVAPTGDPTRVITAAARDLVAKAMDLGWSGPPFDPFALAEILGFSVVPAEDIPEAQISLHSQKARILFNPNKPKTRIWFSIAHEIAHTLFPDWAEEARARRTGRALGDAWQIETLCNLAASELLMPLTAFADVGAAADLHDLLTKQESLGVSVEALLLRFVRLSTTPRALVILSSRDGELLEVDYATYSPSWHRSKALDVPRNSVAYRCSAIGFTASELERWDTEGPMLAEAIGLKGYAGGRLPRVAVLLSEQGPGEVEDAKWRIVAGDVLSPRGGGNRVIGHVVALAPTHWGRGLGSQISKKWPAAQTNVLDRLRLGQAGLGDCVVTQVDKRTWICSMIAQKRLARGGRPGVLSYGSLDRCLRWLARFSEEHEASVHLPKIGAGDAGGQWPIIEEMIRNAFADSRTSVIIYDLLSGRQAKESQQAKLPI
jgi:O-acetyl-ADP-ribose deacetylase (regulator of RNase III)